MTVSANELAAFLPANFILGAATSAYQIEGATKADGRGPSIWDRFLVDPHLPHSAATGEIACDHYNRYKQDVALLKKLNLHAYRFSIAWPRVFPQGKGKLNKAGLDFYDRLVDELLAQGITPYTTLYHWDLPLALQDRFDGWLSRITCSAFADYSRAVVAKLGDRVKHWTTFNEPEVIVAGYSTNGLAPGYNQPGIRFHVGHNLMIAHGMAAKAIRSTRSDAQVGIVLNYNNIDPVDRTLAANAAAHNRFTAAYNWYLQGLLQGSYPDFVENKLLEKVNGIDKWFKESDRSLIRQPLDYLGINYYTRFVVDAEGRDVHDSTQRLTQMGWQIDPFGLARLLDRLNKEFKLPPLYITENGAALDDQVVNGEIHDTERTKFIADHLTAIAAVSRLAKVDVRGYFAWSLMDNLEWPLGYAKTFGLVHVDRTNDLKRTIKDSGHFYAQLAQALKSRSS
ncbi:MAG: beta-glucosidase [Candidatus Obscuribacterales bacterium]|nr:beta-glucosidase [Candidatus Obscuribacterales bacterium]